MFLSPVLHPGLAESQLLPPVGVTVGTGRTLLKVLSQPQGKLFSHPEGDRGNSERGVCGKGEQRVGNDSIFKPFINFSPVFFFLRGEGQGSLIFTLCWVLCFMKLFLGVHPPGGLWLRDS